MSGPDKGDFTLLSDAERLLGKCWDRVSDASPKALMFLSAAMTRTIKGTSYALWDQCENLGHEDTYNSEAVISNKSDMDDLKTSQFSGSANVKLPSTVNLALGGDLSRSLESTAENTTLTKVFTTTFQYGEVEIHFPISDGHYRTLHTWSDLVDFKHGDCWEQEFNNSVKRIEQALDNIIVGVPVAQRKAVIDDVNRQVQCFLEEWGTHFCSGFTFGARYHIVARSETESRESKDTLEAKANAKVDVLLKTAGAPSLTVSGSGTRKSDKKSDTSNITLKLVYDGGDTRLLPSHLGIEENDATTTRATLPTNDDTKNDTSSVKDATNLQDWLKSTRQFPVLLSYRFIRISEFFRRHRSSWIALFCSTHQMKNCFYLITHTRLSTSRRATSSIMTPMVASLEQASPPARQHHHWWPLIVLNGRQGINQLVTDINDNPTEDRMRQLAEALTRDPQVIECFGNRERDTI